VGSGCPDADGVRPRRRPTPRAAGPVGLPVPNERPGGGAGWRPAVSGGSFPACLPSTTGTAALGPRWPPSCSRRPSARSALARPRRRPHRRRWPTATPRRRPTRCSPPRPRTRARGPTGSTRRRCSGRARRRAPATPSTAPRARRSGRRPARPCRGATGASPSPPRAHRSTPRRRRASASWAPARGSRCRRSPAGSSTPCCRASSCWCARTSRGASWRPPASSSPAPSTPRYAAARNAPDLGATPLAGGTPAERTAFALWAPTARRVSVCVYADARGAATHQRPLRPDPATGSGATRSPASGTGGPTATSSTSSSRARASSATA
jgi:hypothetical protein